MKKYESGKEKKKEFKYDLSIAKFDNYKSLKLCLDWYKVDYYIYDRYLYSSDEKNFSKALKMWLGCLDKD